MLRRFLQYYKPHIFLLILDLFCAFLISGSDLIFPMVTRNLINTLIPRQEVRLIFMYGLILLGIYLVRMVLEYVVNYYGHILGIRMEYDMRKDIFAHLQTLSLSYYDNTRTGQIMSRVVNDLFDIAEIAHHGPEDFFISTIKILGAFVLLLTINVRLTLVIFTLVPFMAYFMVTYNLKLEKVFTRVRESIGEVNARIEESISGVRVVKSFAREDFQREKFDIGGRLIKAMRGKSVRHIGVFEAGMDFFANLSLVVTLVAGGYFVSRGSIRVGDLVAYVIYISLFTQPLLIFVRFVEQFQQGMAGFRRFVEIMEQQPEIRDENDAGELDGVKGNIEFEHVGFSYAGCANSGDDKGDSNGDGAKSCAGACETPEICPDLATGSMERNNGGNEGGNGPDKGNSVDKAKGARRGGGRSSAGRRDRFILRDINLKIRPGETVALVGPSGAGKTTLCSLIPRFYEVDEGAIRIDGVDIRRATQASLRSQIGIVAQDVFLFSGTVKENIAYGRLNAAEEEIIAAARAANAHDFIRELPGGYAALIGERGVKLSGGQKQRLSIARVFLKNPPILILDEATSSLDNESEALVQNSIENLAKNRTTLIIAHRLGTIKKANRIIVLTEKGIEEEGTHAELVARRGVYYRLYQSQFEAVNRNILFA